MINTTENRFIDFFDIDQTLTSHSMVLVSYPLIMQVFEDAFQTNYNYFSATSVHVQERCKERHRDLPRLLHRADNRVGQEDEIQLRDLRCCRFQHVNTKKIDKIQSLNQQSDSCLFFVDNNLLRDKRC